MTAAEIRGARQSLGLTQPQMAAAIGVTKRAVQYYEAGERGVPKPVEMLVKNLLQQPAK